MSLIFNFNLLKFLLLLFDVLKRIINWINMILIFRNLFLKLNYFIFILAWITCKIIIRLKPVHISYFSLLTLQNIYLLVHYCILYLQLWNSHVAWIKRSWICIVLILQKYYFLNKLLHMLSHDCYFTLNLCIFIFYQRL